MRFYDYINEKIRYEDTGNTTKDNGHKHEYFIKRLTGDGATSKDKGHFHNIKAMIVLPAKNFKDEHIHKLDTVD
jgi:hypothetical protein